MCGLSTGRDYTRFLAPNFPLYSPGLAPGIFLTCDSDRASVGRDMNIHHINFVVANLDHAVERFEGILGQPVTARDALPNRGALTARFKLGRSWLVLVQPVDPEGAPGQHLARHGEGFFLCSFGVDDLDAHLDRLGATGIPLAGRSRQGLDNWWVQDLDPDHTLGEHLQFTEERGEGD